MRRPTVLVAVLAGALAAGACGGATAAQRGPTSPPTSGAIISGAPTGAPTTGATTTARPTTTVATIPVPLVAPTTVPVTTAPAAPPATSAAAVPSAPCRVAFVGDSVGYGTLRNGFGEELTAVGCTLVWTAGFPGMETAEGAAALTDAPADATVVVVSLGYVNTRSEVAGGHLPTAIAEVLQAAGARLVVWPTLGATADCSRGYTQAVATANGLLQQAQAQAPNLALADYAGLLAAHPEYSEQRCPHLLPAGYGARAAWLAGEVRRLVDQGQPVARGG